MDSNEYIRAATARHIYTRRLSVGLLKRARCFLRHLRLRTLAAEAVGWQARIADGRASKKEFTAWLLKSADHVQVWLELTAFEQELALALNRGELTTSAPTRKSNVVTLPMNRAPPRPRRPFQGLPSKLARAIKLAAAACLIFVLSVTIVSQQYSGSDRVVATRAGQWQHMTLSDGTIMHVDARSRVEVDFRDREARIVHVHEGNVVFDVAKDPNRPFIARTALIDTIATGTRFGISIDHGVTATVSEGSVIVTSRGKVTRKAVTLSAGEQLQVLDSSLEAPIRTKVDAERSLGWANGQLVLDGLTVEEGVKQLNSRNRQQIVIENPTLKATVVPIAIVKVDSPETYARIVAAEPGVTMIIDKENGVIRLSE